MRSIASGGESLGRELLGWGRETFGLTINEFYGQTECNMVISSCGRVKAHIRANRQGRTWAPCCDRRCGRLRMPAGVAGNIAVERPDPVMFLRYWNNEAATAAKFVGNWLLTGDLGERDEQGYIRFIGRDDDVITSGGYRIGPEKSRTACSATRPCDSRQSSAYRISCERKSSRPASYCTTASTVTRCS